MNQVSKQAGNLSHLATTETPLIRNQWYVAGLGSEFTRELKQRYILERSIVFYRTEDNKPVALQNRCAHRSYPLHESRLEGDEIRCNYHGIKYNSQGEITDVPCQNVCPKVKIWSYPVEEIGPFVWIWMGDPDKADTNLLPELREVHNPDEWKVVHGEYNRFEGNYLLMLENLCDLTHFPFLHANTFNASEEYASLPMHIKEEGGIVEFYREVENGWDMNFYSMFYSKEYDHSKIDHKYQNGGRVLAPGMFNGFGTLTPKEGKPLYRYVHHYMTPEHQHSSHYFYYVARNYDLDNPQFDAKMLSTITAAFNEDRDACLEMQKIILEDGHEFKEINVSGDKVGMKMRTIIKQLADAENPA